ncbi:MAG: S8 family serine peptidase [Thermoplasmatota archaeon]
MAGRSLVAGVLVLFVAATLAGALPAAPAALEAPGVSEAAATWVHDLDGDRVDDRIATHPTDALGRVLVNIEYNRPPSDLDVALLRALGASDLYRFNNWDDVQAWIPQAGATVFGTLDGVLRVERLEEASLAVATALPAIRVTASPGTVSSPGMDHGLAVHETLGLRGEGMVIAVLDTGVDNTHVALDDMDDDPTTVDPKLVQKVVDGEVLFGGNDPSSGIENIGCIDPPDSFSHGTHVAGIAVGTAAGQGGPGTAPAAKLVDISLGDVPLGGNPQWVPGIALALDWILDFNAGTSCYGDPGDDTIDVASMSISISKDPGSSINRKLTDMVRNGVVAVVAAGNSGPDTGSIENAAEGAIIVASSNDQGTVQRDSDELSSFSSRGPRPSDGDADTLDELRPDISAPGSNIDAALVGSGTLSWSQSGTSMATPMIAGIAALMLQANPAVAPVDAGSNEGMGGPGAVPIRDLMARTATYLSATENDAVQSVRTGNFGLPWNNGWGYGLVDAYGAVLAARDGLAPVPTACFTSNLVGSTVTVDASCSSAPAGESLTQYHWSWGDGASTTGPSATSHTYSFDGSYALTLTVTASNGQTSSTAQTVVIDSGGGGDPDPDTPTLHDGQPHADSITVIALGATKEYKVRVPPGTAALRVDLDGPDCELDLCLDDVDVKVGPGLPASSPGWTCTAGGPGNDHACVVPTPAAGWWTVQVIQHDYLSGSSFTFTSSGVIPETAYTLTASLS